MTQLSCFKLSSIHSRMVGSAIRVNIVGETHPPRYLSVPAPFTIPGRTVLPPVEYVTGPIKWQQNIKMTSRNHMNDML